MKRYPLMLGLRLFGSSSRLSRYLKSAVLGIGLSLIPLIVVLEVADGMIEGITRRYVELGTYHLQVLLPEREAAPEQLLEELEAAPEVRLALTERRGLGLLYTADSRLGVTIRAVPPSLYERDEDALSDDPPVFTKTFSLGSEAMWSFSGRGTANMKYKIARGTSSGSLPFTRYDFHEGISHLVRVETSYRLEWFTDLTARLIYRAEISEDEKPDHRLEMEMTANF